MTEGFPSSDRFAEAQFDEAGEQEKSLPGWEQRYSQISPGRFRGTVSSIHFPALSIIRERMNVAVEQTYLTPKNSLLFFCLPRASGGFRIDGEHHGGATVGFGFSRSERLIVTEPCSDVLMVVADLAGFKAGIEPRNGVLASGDADSPADEMSGWLISLLEVYRTGGERFAEQLDALLPDLIRDRLGRLLATGRFEAPDRDDDRDAALKLYCRVHAWLEAHPREPATVADLSRILKVPQSQLRKSCLATVGHSLDALLLSLRLNHARRDIIASRGEGRRISDVALDWGFPHWGRFALRYRHLFDERPSQTLRQPLMQ